MKHVAILIPASPVPAFFSQIAAFSLALKSLRWSRWRPSLHVLMGGEVDHQALQKWLPYLDDVAITLVPRRQCLLEGIWAQYDGVFHQLPRDADVILRMDADILPIAEFEEVLDRVAEIGCIAGTIEHFPFSTSVGLARSEDWQGLARDLIGAPLNLAFRYTLLPDPEWPAPFYVNFGAVYFAGPVWREFCELYLRFRPQLVDRLGEPYFAGQVAFALAVAKMDAPIWALPMRYNFPNDSRAVSLHPEELSQISILHYLRTSRYDRHRIFTNSVEYSRFMAMSLDGVDLIFQQAVNRIVGSEYPFEPSEVSAALTHSAARKRIDAPLARVTYEAVVAEHNAVAAAGLAGIEAEIAALTPDEDEPAAAHPVGEIPASALDYANEFEASGRLDLESLMRFKQALVNTFGVEKGFAVFRERLNLPDSGQLRLKRLESQCAFGRQKGEVFIETAPGGEHFVIDPPVIIGEGIARPLEHVSRSLYVACVADARVRGRSAVIDVDDVALLDYQGSERDLFDCELDIDPAIFHAKNDVAWIAAPEDPDATIEVGEAFMLLGPLTGAWGDSMEEYLPRYIAADMSGALPPVPILIDARLPKTIRQSLDLMLRPGVELIEIPTYTTARVRRLWYAPNLHYAPAYEIVNARFKWDHRLASPALFFPVVREMARRADLILPEPTGPERVFLGRRTQGWRKLVNHAAIAAAAKARGFHVVFPEDLDFAEQANLLRGARFVVAPEGSTLYLMYFARPGTRLCILNHTLVEAATSYKSQFAGIRITIPTGPIIQNHAEFPHRADYAIDENGFCAFLDEWLLEDVANQA